MRISNLLSALLIQLCEVSSGITYAAALQVANNPLFFLLQHGHVFARCSTQFGFGYRRHALACLLLQIRIEPLFWIKLRALTGQIKQPNFLAVLCYPSLFKPAVMDPQVVQYQEHFFACIRD